MEGIALRPPRVVFAQWQPGRVYTKRCKVVNTAGVAQRVYVLPPGPGTFRVELVKAGMLAAGMCQTLTVVFTPTDDSPQRAELEVVGETGALRLPIEAAGTAGMFPKRLALPCRRAGQPARVVAQLHNSNSEAVAFAFRLLRERTEVSFAPREGVLKPGEVLGVEVGWLAREGGEESAVGELVVAGEVVQSFELWLVRPKAKQPRQPSRGQSRVELPPLPVQSAPSPPPLAAPSTQSLSSAPRHTPSPMEAFNAEFARVTELCKERSIRLTRQPGVDPAELIGFEETLHTALQRADEERKAAILAELLQPSDDSPPPCPVRFPEDVLQAPKTGGVDLVSTRMRRRLRFEAAARRVIVRNRLERVLTALRAALRTARQATTLKRPFLPPMSLADALELPAPALAPRWRLPSLPALPFAAGKERQPQTGSPAEEDLLAADEQTRLPPVEPCLAESNGYTPVDLFGDYVFVPRLAEVQPGRGELNEDLLFDEAAELPQVFDPQSWRLPEVHAVGILRDFQRTTLLLQPLRVGPVWVEAAEGTPERELSQPPPGRTDPLFVPRLPAVLDEVFVSEFVAKASNYASQKAFFALKSERDLHSPPRNAYDVFLTKAIDEYCPRRITQVFKDDLAEQLSSDSEDEKRACTTFALPPPIPPTALSVANHLAEHIAGLNALLLGHKLFRVGQLQTLKADVSGYAVSPANRLML